MSLFLRAGCRDLWPLRWLQAQIVQCIPEYRAHYFSDMRLLCVSFFCEHAYEFHRLWQLEDIGKVVMRYPGVLGTGINKIDRTIEFLRVAGVMEMAKMIARHPQVCVSPI